MRLIPLVLAAGCLSSTACAGAMIRPTLTPATAATDALLVLPGFGYGRRGEETLRALAPSMAADGIDLYVATYIARSGLEESRARLQRYVREQRLDRYERVHVFAFIAGGWTFNAMVRPDTLPNLASVVYDRSPYQERAPLIARERLPLPAWLKYGSLVFDVATTPYTPLDLPGVRVGLLVETAPTRFIQRFAVTAGRYGPYEFDCGAFGQRHDDCAFVAMNHDEMYERFDELWPDVRAFIRAGRFPPSANRTPPIVDRQARSRR